MQTRPPLDELGLDTGTKTRLPRILFESLRFVETLRGVLANHPSQSSTERH